MLTTYEKFAKLRFVANISFNRPLIVSYFV